jgi:hypothetical protein
MIGKRIAEDPALVQLSIGEAVTVPSLQPQQASIRHLLLKSKDDHHAPVPGVG